MSLGTYKKIEYGSRMPTLEDVQKFADLMEVDPSIFFNQSGPTVHNSGTYNAGKGNLIINEKELVLSLITSVEKISQVLNKLVDKIEKSDNQNQGSR